MSDRWIGGGAAQGGGKVQGGGGKYRNKCNQCNFQKNITVLESIRYMA
jgi:hypothetical protein